ncbi:hypothetical protein Q4489_08095 [Thalassotalea sp. 1_MG-2023]|uniref:hypothetical protein n=1 Tax=Thalassotalea sp. 1_MG-2023 TaxID=3062680 RepID=UPI0026E182D8|nr:hypothetical protein [Thalassotalea sp. 1_MG-2023]MDO6426967.1 hypothetical protein [Thalassotalea sp. 1_MG-2023]
MSNLTTVLTTTKRQLHWLNVQSIHEVNQASMQYVDICQRHASHKKWVLLVNPEGEAIAALNDLPHLDKSKILKVNTTKTPVSFDNIKSALCKGNCSAVVLCNPCLKQQEIAELQKYARLGKTECVVLTNNKTIH